MIAQELNLGGPGLRVAVKDTIDIAGYPTRAGSKALAGARPAQGNADVVQRVLDAGCRIIGKTMTHELALGATGINQWAGTPINPIYPDRIPGGSSSGSAAAVAAGIADFALGSDTGGSIRLPATCCGVFGLKPTFGRVRRCGVAPAVSSLDCVGPFAPNATLLIEAMQIIDPTFGEVPTAPFRIGLVEVEAEQGITSAVAAALRAAALDISTVQLGGLETAFQAGLAIINAEAWSAFGHLLDTGQVGADVAARLLRGRDTPAADLAAAEAVRRAFAAEVDAAFETVDVLALPTMPEIPMRLAEALADRSGVRMTAFVRPFNLSGHPALSMPLRTQDGLPAGLQLVGRKGEDEALCALARHMEQAGSGGKDTWI
jgi:amidase